MYRDLKKYNNDAFREELLIHLHKTNDETCYDIFEHIFIQLLNIHSPQKKKILRGNQQSFMTKELSNAIMKRGRLPNIYTYTYRNVR